MRLSWFLAQIPEWHLVIAWSVQICWPQNWTSGILVEIFFHPFNMSSFKIHFMYTQFLHFFFYTFWTLSVEVHTSCWVEKICITKNRPERVQSARKLTSIKLININLLNLVILVSQCLWADWFMSLTKHMSENIDDIETLPMHLIQQSQRTS